MIHTLPLFVYGTLRKDLSLHRLLRHAIVEEVSVGECYVDGFLHYAPRADYPVLTPPRHPWQPQTFGDLYIVDEADQGFVYVLLMELGAGYSCEWVPVYDRNTGEKLMNALAFTWKSSEVGRLIESGDWSKEEVWTGKQ